MREKMWRNVFWIWRSAQKNNMTFHFVLWLKKIGITAKVKSWLVDYRDAELRKHPSEGMWKSRRFCTDNQKRISDMLLLLYDKKSRDVWGGVMDYRMGRVPIKKEYYSEDDQYFASDVVRDEEREVFVDGGAYTGDTIKEFMKIAKKENVKIRGIIAFEPNENNYRLLKEIYGNRKQIKLIKKGLSDKEETLMFWENGNASRITDDESKATIKVPVINIDAVPECKDATWIKMDIEGAELSALQGTKETILRNRPKLTICIYHSDEDMVRIAEYIHELVAEYKLYVRHHTKSQNETVLYAVI